LCTVWRRASAEAASAAKAASEKSDGIFREELVRNC